MSWSEAVNEGLFLTPDVKLRPDGNRSILFSVERPDSRLRNIFRFLYPQQAVILALFDGKRKYSEIKETTAYLFGLKEREASDVVESIMSLAITKELTVGSLIVSASEVESKRVRVYDPRDFIVPADSVNFIDVRCNMPCAMLVLPTMRCVTDCLYCYADHEGCENRQEFDLPFFDRLLIQATECGIETIHFSGGDLFSRKDAFELIQLALKHDMYVSIPTKYPLTRDKVMRLADLGLPNIQISIDALCPDIIDKLMQVPGYGEKILETINHLSDFGIGIRTNTVLTPYNIYDAINLMRFLAKHPNVYRMNFTCYVRSIYHHDDSLFCSSIDVDAFEKEFNQIKREFPGKEISFGGGRPDDDPFSGSTTERTKAYKERSFCTANRRAVIVLPDGQVTVCEELYYHKDFIIGDLKKQSLMDVWNSPKAIELAYPQKETFPDGACKDCPDFKDCHEGLGRCYREAIKVYGSDHSHWPDPRCPYAPVVANSRSS